MQSALRIETKVLPGNKIEIELPPNTALNVVGETIEVIPNSKNNATYLKVGTRHCRVPTVATLFEIGIILILPDKSTGSTPQSILGILAEIHSQRPSSRSVAEINRALQGERDAWDS